MVLLGYFSRLSHGAAGDIRLSQFRCKRPTGARHYSHLPRNDLLQHILKSLATGTGLETYLFVSQQNTDDTGIYLSVLLVFVIIPRGNRTN